MSIPGKKDRKNDKKGRKPSLGEVKGRKTGINQRESRRRQGDSCIYSHRKKKQECRNGEKNTARRRTYPKQRGKKEVYPRLLLKSQRSGTRPSWDWKKNRRGTKRGPYKMRKEGIEAAITETFPTANANEERRAREEGPTLETQRGQKKGGEGAGKKETRQTALSPRRTLELLGWLKDGTPNSR